MVVYILFLEIYLYKVEKYFIYNDIIKFHNVFVESQFFPSFSLIEMVFKFFFIEFLIVYDFDGNRQACSFVVAFVYLIFWVDSVFITYLRKTSAAKFGTRANVVADFKCIADHIENGSRKVNRF